MVDEDISGAWDNFNQNCVPDVLTTYFGTEGQVQAKTISHFLGYARLVEESIQSISTGERRDLKTILQPPSSS